MPKTRLTEPRIVKKPRQKMAVVTTYGDPNKVLADALPPLYSSVYTLKFDLKKAGKETFKVGALFGRWPNLPDAPKDQWVGIVGLPIPSNTRKLPQKDPRAKVRIETWDYGPAVAEILHIGPYSEEAPAIQKLQQFIEHEGYRIAGMHEEEYLTSPNAKVRKTIIRYPVVKKRASR